MSKELKVSKSIRLKPCPFCGSNVQCDHGDTNAPFLFFRCRRCGAVVSFANEICDAEPIKAIGYWNRRMKYD